MNLQAVDAAVNELYEVSTSRGVTSNIPMNKYVVPADVLMTSLRMQYAK